MLQFKLNIIVEKTIVNVELLSVIQTRLAKEISINKKRIQTIALEEINGDFSI